LYAASRVNDYTATYWNACLLHSRGILDAQLKLPSKLPCRPNTDTTFALLARSYRLFSDDTASRESAISSSPAKRCRVRIWQGQITFAQIPYQTSQRPALPLLLRFSS
jgi:hypothetical protein